MTGKAARQSAGAGRHPVDEQLQLFVGETPALNVRVSPRAKRMSIRVFPYGRVEVVVPRRTGPRTVQRFISGNRDWIDRTSRELQARCQDADPPTRIRLAALHRSWTVRYVTCEAQWTQVVQSRTLLEVRGPDARGESGRVALRRWLALQGREHLPPRLARLAARTRLHYQRVQIRNQRTRWGSCSASGTISLNCCLLFLSSDLVRYLMVHELCHTRCLDHSHRYWDLVERHEPNARTLDRRLADAWRDVPPWATRY
ncbi:SprT family zinc-dependent metalloprotease [soil metagenome]